MTEQTAVITKCYTCQHPEFCLLFDSSIPKADVDVLLSYLEESVQGGTRYEDGQIIAFGSMLFRLAILGDLLTIQEPDLQTVPIAWRAGVTQSMKLLRLQKEIAESVGVGDEIDHPSIRSSLLAGIDLKQQCGAFILDRMEPTDSDSGWFVGRQDTVLDYNDSANFNRISVYQALLSWPQLGVFLALPAGCRVDTSEASAFFSRYGQPLEVVKGSFLDVVASRGRGSGSLHVAINSFNG